MNSLNCLFYLHVSVFCPCSFECSQFEYFNFNVDVWLLAQHILIDEVTCFRFDTFDIVCDTLLYIHGSALIILSKSAVISLSLHEIV